MSYGGGRRSGVDLSETFQSFLDGAAKLVATLGGLATLGATAFLAVICFRLGGNTPDVKPQDANTIIETLQKVLIVGSIGFAIGATYLFWGSEFLIVGLLALSGAMFFAPTYLPSLTGTPNGPAAASVGAAMGALQTAGTILGLIAIASLVIDVVGRVAKRSKEGTKADQLKYGKGVKEESGTQNVFMGKCWQLPFCRKFVRERCPIFHAKTSCWKELVGCMCEEQVIRNAMENKPIPKDALLAGNMIPRNNKLTVAQKKERCRNCVIYNEHQRHKYKISMPVLVGAFGLVYAVFHGPLIDGVNRMVDAVNQVVHKVSLSGGDKGFTAPTFFTETLLAVFFVIGLTYAMKTLEYLIFRTKL